MNPFTNLDRCHAFINCHANPANVSPDEQKPAVGRRAVTLSRQTGCGALAIAEQLRDILQTRSLAGAPPWTVFDQNLIERILAEHNLPKRLSKFMAENRVSWITDTMEELFGLHPSAEVLVRQTAETILHLAQIGNVIIIGRGANIITAGLPHALHVRLVGSVEKRVERLCHEVEQTREVAFAFLKKEDEGRRRYLKSYYHADIENPLLYHLTMNTDSFTPEGAAQLIANALTA